MCVDVDRAHDGIQQDITIETDFFFYT
uniref:Uncharacterized protein n=1 Tax=Anguilla anguilla TaxID=7936 RepID=A0A0E9TMM4_ANGAN